MNKIYIIILLITSYISANINAVVTIMPQKSFLEAIGGDKVSVSVMVLPGSSPHTYEPKPSQMINISRADIYFTIGVEFEHIWMTRLADLNKKMKILDSSFGVKRHHMAHRHDENKAKKSISSDPHIWTSPKNVSIIVKNICAALVKLDPLNQEYYKENLSKFLSHIEDTDKKIKLILSELKNSRKFMVFHPSWGYFAKEYDLEQIAVEMEGKEPKAKELISLLKLAKQEHINAIFTQKEFSDKVANIISDELSIPVVKISPLASDWALNLLFFSNTIANR